MSLRSPVSTVFTVMVTTPPLREADAVGGARTVDVSSLLELSASMGVIRYLRALSFIWIVRRMSHCVMFTVFVEKPGAPMLVSARSRAPLIIVVLSFDCPAMVVLMVILKSPVMGLSSAGLLCVELIVDVNEVVQTRLVNRTILDF